MKADPDHMADPSTAPSAWNLPNALTVVRIALVPVFLWLLLHAGGQQTGWRLGAWAAFSLAILTDRVDGELARRRNLVTDFGKVADPIADKALVGAALVALSALGELSWWVTVVILVRELGITALRFVVIRHGVMPASHGGKVKTVLQATAIGLYLLPLQQWFGAWATAVAWWVMLAAVAVTVVTGLDYVYQALHLRRHSARTAMKKARRGSRG